MPQQSTKARAIRKPSWQKSADLDTRIVDLMDDVAASGADAGEYIAFYDQLTQSQRLAGRAAELICARRYRA